MRLRFRLLLLLLSSFWKRPLAVLDESVLSFTVLPNDIDLLKITDDRYFALMDLGRMDIAFRAGVLKLMLKNGWGPVVTLNTLRFRYPLRLFQRYQLKTRIVWWDEANFYWHQSFERKGRVLASGYVCGGLLGKHGQVPPHEVLSHIAPALSKPAQPEIATHLKELERLIHQTQKENHGL